MKKLLYIMIAAILAALLLLHFQPTLFPAHPSPSDLEAAEEAPKPVRLTFDADSAYAYCAAQCEFGPRTMNSEAHAQCAEWLKSKFRQFGCTVQSQRATLAGYDGTKLESENIIAQLNPEASTRLLFCAHWDSRPWADNDPDEANWHKPVIAANDGASGVAVMLEIARMLQADSVGLSVGVDFVCFDAEDWGTPQWSDAQDTSDSWALGSQYWAENNQTKGYQYGILLDMVGGEGARFYQEGMSLKYAPDIVDKVWKTARRAGYGTFFPKQTGGYITDDHVPVNEIAHIPCIDIIAYYPDCPQSTFGPTWHTVNDTMEHISVSTLRAVGQTLAHLLSEY